MELTGLDKSLSVYMLCTMPDVLNFVSYFSSLFFLIQSTMLPWLLLAICAPALVVAQAVEVVHEKICIVEPCGDGDSAPAIIEAFEKCGHMKAPDYGKVVFLNETYNIKSAMNTTGLSNVDIDLQGTLLWDTNIPYWLNHSLPVGYQNQSSAWLFGGDNINWNGNGYGMWLVSPSVR